MQDLATLHLFPAFWMAFGGLLLGAAAMVDFSQPGKLRTGIRWSLGTFAFGNLIAGWACAFSSQPIHLLLAFFWVFSLHFLFFVVPTAQGRESIRRLNIVLCHRKARFAVLASLGIAASIGTLHWSYASMPAEEAADLKDNPIEEGQVALEDVSDSPASTDRGRRILVRTNTGPSAGRLDDAALRRQFDLLTTMGLRDQVIHLPVGWQNCNCHGWVFTEGRYWVGGDEVDKILKDNRYRQVDHPGVGDLVVYRHASTKAVTHTGIVRYVGPNGFVLVESKWGNMGRFMHPHNVHCYLEDNWSFHRSPRKGHTLLGLQGNSGTVPPDSEMLAPFIPHSPVESIPNDF